MEQNSRLSDTFRRTCFVHQCGILFQNALTSFIFFSLKMNKADAFNLMIGANTLYFCVDKMHEMALWRPLVNNPCNKLEYLTNFGSSAKSSTTNRMLNKSFCLFFSENQVLYAECL